MGFSFGARLAQSMLPDLAGQLDQLYLLSPDGPETKGLSTAAQVPVWFRRLFMRAFRRPDNLLPWVRWGHKMRLISPIAFHFLSSNLTRPERCQRTFCYWLAMDSFQVDQQRIRSILRETRLPTEVYIGLNDPLLRKKTLKKRYEGMPNVRVCWLEDGHQIIGKQLADELRKS